MNYATERVSERCQIKAKRQQRAKQGTTIEPLRGIFRTCLNPNRLLEPVQILCIVEHIVCLILEDAAAYVKKIRQARCRQANER